MKTALLLPVLSILAACATATPAIPAEAEQSMRTLPNGDVISEYRIAGQLRAVKVVPSRGPTYYLYDLNGDGIVDEQRDNPPQTYYKLFEW